VVFVIVENIRTRKDGTQSGVVRRSGLNERKAGWAAKSGRCRAVCVPADASPAVGDRIVFRASDGKPGGPRWVLA
jgi:hypothetical protein